SLGWNRSLENSSPILSYSELGGMLEEGPSRLFDALNRILGLDAISGALAALKEARTSRESQEKAANAERGRLLPLLSVANDPRAKHAQEAVSGKEWKLDEVEALLTGLPQERSSESDIQKLKRLA